MNDLELDDPVLQLLAEQVDDLEKLRVANENRYRNLTTVDLGKDGQERGLNLPEDDPDVMRLRTIIDGTKALEVEAIKQLEKKLRNSPWSPFQKESRGVGAKMLARLLAAIGDPYWNARDDRPRTVSELWACCGFHVVDGAAPRRRKGAQSNWSEDARKRAWLIASKCVVVGKDGEYREEYDRLKEYYADAVHNTVCVRCGPAGKPAQIGSPISDGHRHARALRGISKLLLKNLWIEARYLHGDDPDWPLEEDEA